MVRRTSLRALSSAVLFALLVTALHPQPAWAEEGTPPPADPAATETPASGEPVDDSIATPAPDPSEALPPVDVSGVPAADASGVPPADLLALVPEGTTVAVVDAQGDPVPLVSEQAAEIVASGDPIWCPASVSAPTPLLNGCTDSHASLLEVINDLMLLPGEPAVDGVIWFADDYDSSAVEGGATEISLTSGMFPVMSLYKLTLRGGWSGTPGDKTITPIDPATAVTATTFHGTRLQILGWQNDVTLTDIVFEYTSGDGLLVTTTGNISATRIFSHDNAGTGAQLDNRSATAAKTVTVSSSQFNSNAGSNGGLYVLSEGKITLANVVASDNLVPGATLDNTYALTAQPVVLTGLSTFNDNANEGLVIYSFGAITAADLTATDNGGWGARLFNYWATTPQAVTLTGTNIFTENTGGGLDLSSAGAIKLNNVIADSNDGIGAQVLNTGALTAQPVTLTGTSTFKYNQSTGLYISATGAVTLNNISASGSRSQYGLQVNNRTLTPAPQPITLTGTNTFNDNFGSGVYVQSDGLIKLNSVTALGNGLGGSSGYGAYLYNAWTPNTAGVTLTGTNNLSGNYSTGLRLTSMGPVSISNLTASDAVAGHGADLDNSSAATPQKVTLTGKNVFSGNSGHGLVVYSHGAIAASDLTVTGNGHAGGGSPGAYLYNAGVGGVGGVTLSGVNRITDNGQNGLGVYTTGVISISSLTSTGNGYIANFGNGAYLSNDYAAAPGAGLTLSGTNLFSDNYTTGLIAYSKGPISLSNLSASGNQHGYGVDASNQNSGPASPQKLALTGTGAFHDNSQTGLALGSYGAITAASFAANGNGQTGASLYNAGGTSAQPVTLTGSFTTSTNGQNGLVIYSLGLIKVSNVTANNNDSSGVVLANNYVNRTGGITLSGINSITDNFVTGLGLYSRGPITVNSLTATGNGIDGGSGYGADIENYEAITAQPVKLTGTNVFSGNRSTGLYIGAAGAVSVNNLTASGSVAGSGAIISNDDPFSAPITLTGVGTFDDNYGHGLQATSWGAISLNTTRLEASHNGVTYGNGLRLFNDGAAAPQKVALTGPVFVNDNYGEGLYLQSKGAVTINSLTASEARHAQGVAINNDITGAVGGVTLGGTNVLQDNWGQGLSLSSLGAVTINSLTATGNGFGNFSGSGASINNAQFPVPAVRQPVKLTGLNNLSGNYGAGLWIRSNGAISLNGLTASDSYRGHGVDLANDDAGSVGGITLTGTNVFSDNYNSGLEAYSLGAISVNNLSASGNGISNVWGFGAVLDNHDALTPQAVKLTGSNTFNNNLLDGLYANSRGAISANNLTANGSRSGGGVALSNNYGDGFGVTITGSNVFSENDSVGLGIDSDGVIALTKIFADGNTNTGLQVFNNTGGATVTCGSFVNNGSYGVYYGGSGVFKLVGLIASGNSAGDIGWAGGALFVSTRACPLS